MVPRGTKRGIRHSGVEEDGVAVMHVVALDGG